MDTNNALSLLLFAGLGLAVWALILQAIIGSANETKRRDKIQLQNQRLLAKMAEKLGVDDVDIQEALKKDYKL